MAIYRYRVKMNSAAMVDIEADSHEDALAELRASVGVGQVVLGVTPCETPIIGSTEMDDEEPELIEVDGEGLSECQNCEARWAEADLKEVKHLGLRVAPGEPMPSGECPSCGAVCHLLEPVE